MQPLDQYPIYELGAALQELKDAASKRGAERTDQFNALWMADYHLSRLINGVPFKVSFCLGAAHALVTNVRQHLHDLRTALASPEQKQMSQAHSDYRWYTIRQGIDVFEHQFSAELQKTATYAVPDRGIFKTEGLVDTADLHIHPQCTRL